MSPDEAKAYVVERVSVARQRVTIAGRVYQALFSVKVFFDEPLDFL